MRRHTTSLILHKSRKDGKIVHRALAKELLTESELLTVAQRQGFANLKEVERCVLVPGGAFLIQGKGLSRDERRHAELMAKLEQLHGALADLQRQARAR